MTVWKVLLIVLAALWLISLVRVGARVRYGEEGLFLLWLLGPFKLQLFPAEEETEEKREPEKKRKKEKPPKEEKHKKKPDQDRPGALSRLMQLLPVVGQACGALKRKIRIDELKLKLIWGGSDPAAIALGYGHANAVLGMLWPVFDNNFKVMCSDFQIGMDYGRTRPVVELEVAATFTVGQITALSVHYGVKTLITWVKSGRTAGKRQEAMSHE
jgi:hypothetical protein